MDFYLIQKISQLSEKVPFQRVYMRNNKYTRCICELRGIYTHIMTCTLMRGSSLHILHGKSFGEMYLNGILKNGTDLLKRRRDVLLRMMTNKN